MPIMYPVPRTEVSVGPLFLFPWVHAMLSKDVLLRQEPEQASMGVDNCRGRYFSSWPKELEAWIGFAFRIGKEPVVPTDA